MPKKVQRVLRKIPPSHAATMDDQAWPVNAALFVLGSFLTGELIALGMSADASLWQNAWVMAALVWGAIFASMFLVHYTGSVVARRTQLSLVLALLLFLILLTACAFVPIFVAQATDENAAREVVQQPEVTLPDYIQVVTIDRPQIEWEHERPVDTQTPETQPTDVVQQKVEPLQEVPKQAPTPEPTTEVVKQADATPREKPTPRKTPPRHSETPSRLSRQSQPTQPQPKKVASPTVVKASQPKPSTRIKAPTRALTPRKTQAVTQRPTPQETPTTQSRQPKVQTARRPTPRAKRPTVSSLLARKAPNERPRRTNPITELAAALATVARSADVQSAKANPSATRPRAASLSRSRRGMAGAGQQKNLDRGEPARRTVSEVASASARRKHATSESPEEDALATSRQARVAKGRAMADAPASTLEAQVVEVASAAGVKNPSDINATSSAAMRNRSAAKTLGSVTADAGSMDFDTGPTQIASELSTGRASGGGEPDLNHVTQTPDASRHTTTDGANLAALDTRAIAPQPTDIATEEDGAREAETTDRATTQIRRRHASGDADLATKATTENEPADVAEEEPALNAPSVSTQGRHASLTAADARASQPHEPSNASGGAPLRTAATAVIPGVTKVTVDETELASGGAMTAPTNDPVQFGAGEGSVQRRQTGGTQAIVRAEPGEGGIGAEPSPHAGNPNRKAQRQSDVVAVSTDARFQQRDLGGPKFSGDTRARDSQIAFEGRKKQPGSEGRGTPPRTLEVAIQSGLEFLKRHQLDNGSWSFNDLGRSTRQENRRATVQSDAAATGLALMCFLGAGYDHFDYGEKYASEVQSALDFLVEHQQEDGNLYIERDRKSSETAALYSHAIATMALCEAYGMTRDPKLKAAAQRAIEAIEKTQHDPRGGWRYVPGKSTDLSVTGWMVAALKSGDLAGLTVQPKTYEAARRFLRSCQADSAGSRYVYSTHAPDSQSHGRRASVSMTAVGLLLQLYDGRDRTHRAMQRGAAILADNLPAHTRAKRDTYYWYYATQVMFHMRGDHWDRWQQRLQSVLWSTQDQSGPTAGSWNPRGRIPDRWGAHGGRIYVTTLNLLSLEVSYRYLPLYQETDR